jgi:LPXTG-motif cell wall-anchored protein
MYTLPVTGFSAVALAAAGIALVAVGGAFTLIAKVGRRVRRVAR